MNDKKAALLDQIRVGLDRLSPAGREEMLTFVEILTRSPLTCPHVLPRVKRNIIEFQKRGYIPPEGFMDLLDSYTG